MLQLNKKNDMNNLFLINEEERNRILGMHETATKKHYLSEQPTLDLGQPTQPQVGPQNLQDTAGTIIKQGIGGDPYVYGKLGNDYYYAKSSDGDYPNWVLATNQGAINSIKSKIYNETVPVVKTVKAPEKGKTKVQKTKINKDKDSNKKFVDKETNKTVIDNTRVKRTNVDKMKLVNKNKTNTGVVVSKSVNPRFKKILDTSKLDTTNSIKIFKAGQPNCAQFVNDFDDNKDIIGNAWDAHDLDSVGNRVWSSFVNLPSDKRNEVINLWKKINKSGGGEDNGPFTNSVKSFVSGLIPKVSPVSLKLNDIVGLFYPGSKHHEMAFYNSGKPYFTKNSKGEMVAGKTIQGGKGWGMNTHVGIVGAIKDGVPIVFHNIGGQVYADPYTNIKGDSKIAWVKRG